MTWKDKYRICLKIQLAGLLSDEELEEILGIDILPITPEVKSAIRQNRKMREDLQKRLKSLDTPGKP